MRDFALSVGILALVASACTRPSVARSSARPSCDAYVDADAVPYVKPDAILTWQLDEGQPGHEYAMLLQIDRSGTISFVDVRWSEPGPNGLGDRTKAPGKCFTRRLTADAIAGLEATLVANHFCAQKVNAPDSDTAPQRFDVHFGALVCKVQLDTNVSAMTDDARAAFGALVKLENEDAR